MFQKNERKYSPFAFILVFLVFIIYSNTFYSPWILDDFHNVVNNSRIQIKSLSLESIKGSFYSANPEKIYRPLSCLTFALNAFISGKNVFGYHLVNISLHAATALAVMWLLILVFNTPALEKIPDKEKHFVILLSSVLWAVNPIQIQAVTYIVQRMAALCAFFSILSMGFFLKFKLANATTQKCYYIICCIMGIACSFFSKENGIITVPLILVLEYFLFNGGDYKALGRKKFIITFLIFIFFALCFLIYTEILPKLMALYDNRPFTLYERILTQPKILFYYLSLIFYPLPQRFSLEHEIIISSGIVTPPQTFLYIVLVIFSFAVCIVSSKIPFLLRLGLVFYFVAHSIESSILPLEMVFEHRNYLPTVFTFPPVAAGLYQLLTHYKSRQLIKISCIFFISAIIFLTSMATYTRNFDWRSNEAIWFDAMMKAPGNARPKQSMGFAIGMKNPEKALDYYAKGLTGYMHNPKDEKASTLTNMGLIFFHQNKYGNARRFFEQAIQIDEKYQIAIYFLIQTYMKEGLWNKAIEIIDKNANSLELSKLKALSFLHTSNYQQALDLFSKIYRNQPDNQNNLLNLAESFSMAGYPKKALFFYGMYFERYPEDMKTYLRIAKHYYLNGDIQNASESLNIFFKNVGIENAEKDFLSNSEDMESPMIGAEKMQPFIASEFERYKNNIKWH